MAKIVTYIGLALLAFTGSALDSTGMAGYIAIAGVLAGLGLMWAGARMEKKEGRARCIFVPNTTVNRSARKGWRRHVAMWFARNYAGAPACGLTRAKDARGASRR